MFRVSQRAALSAVLLLCTLGAAQAETERLQLIKEAQRKIDAASPQSGVRLDPAATGLKSAIAEAAPSAPYLELREPQASRAARARVRRIFAAAGVRLFEIAGRPVLAPAEAPVDDLPRPVVVRSVAQKAVATMDDVVTAIDRAASAGASFIGVGVDDFGRIRGVAFSLSAPQAALGPSPSALIRREGETLTVRIFVFEPKGLADRIVAAVRDAERRGAPIQRIVFDLRVSSGGALSGVVELLFEFAESQSVVLRATKGLAGLTRVRAPRRGRLVGVATEIWVSRFTYSGAEIFAQAMRSTAGSRVIGERTPGKCVAQQEIRLSNGALLLAPLTELRDGDGRSCLKWGVALNETVGVERLFGPAPWAAKPHSSRRKP